MKPNVVAPGNVITSLQAGTTDQYKDDGGTSMASPPRRWACCHLDGQLSRVSMAAVLVAGASYGYSDGTRQCDHPQATTAPVAEIIMA